MTNYVSKLITAFWLTLAFGAPLHAQQNDTSRAYSATAIHALPDQPQTAGKIVKSGQNLRLEFVQNGKNVIQILRPVDGLMYILDPQTQTYFELRGQAVPKTAVEGFASPCPETAQLAQCQRIGSDVVSGIQVERWLLATQPQSQPITVLWDPTRSKALRQEFPDGSVVAMTFKAMETLNGRGAEHWTMRVSSPQKTDLNGDWWFDPKLRVVVREDLPSGELRRLENIQVGAVDPRMFMVPDGWRKQDAPTLATPQAPVGARAGN